MLNLVKSLGNEAFGVKVFGSDLRNVEVNQITIVAIEFKKFVALKSCGVDVVLNVNVLMGQNVLGLSVLVSGCLNIMDLEVILFFCFVDSEEEVLASHYLLIRGLAKRFLVELVFEVL